MSTFNIEQKFQNIHWIKLFSTSGAGEAEYLHAGRWSCTKTNFKDLSVKHWAARRKCHIEEPCIVQNLLNPLVKN